MSYKERLISEAMKRLATGEAKRGEASFVRVLRDDWCPLLNGGEECHCEAEIVFEPLVKQ